MGAGPTHSRPRVGQAPGRGDSAAPLLPPPAAAVPPQLRNRNPRLPTSPGAPDGAADPVTEMRQVDPGAGERLPLLRLPSASARPVNLTLTDDLVRSRGTVFFRLDLRPAVPHLARGVGDRRRCSSPWPTGWRRCSGGVAPARCTTSSPGSSASRPIRTPICNLAAEPLPAFDGKPGYAVDLEIGPPRRQNRWTVGFRAVLALPALALVATLAGSGSPSSHLSQRRPARRLLGCSPPPPSSAGSTRWLGRACPAACATCRLRALLRRAVLGLPAAAHRSLPLERPADRDRPAPDPLGPGLDGGPRRAAPQPPHRLLPPGARRPPSGLAGAVGDRAVLAAIVNWFATLISGTSPAVAAPLPLRLRALPDPRRRLPLPGRQPVPGLRRRRRAATRSTSTSPPRQRQNRWTVAFRLILALPALVLAGAFGSLLASSPSSAGSPRWPPAGCPSACATPVPSPCATPPRPAPTSSWSAPPIPTAGPAWKRAPARRPAVAAAGA